jgi:hypothetical protein
MSQIPGVGRVHIRLDGLMIGQFLKDENDGKPFCEIGVLSNAKGHKFTVCYEVAAVDGITGKNVDLPGGDIWELGIEGAEPDVEPFLSNVAPNRLNGPPEGASTLERQDFRWVLNLESADFPQHPESVVLRDDQLKPKIRIKNGIVFNQQLIQKPLMRLLNGGAPEEFGVASDELGINLDPKPGQEVVLKNADTGIDIFRIPVKEGEKVSIFINNVPPGPPSGNHFHFHMYYGALEVPADRQYDFRVKEVDPVPAHDPGGHEEHGGGNPHDHNPDSAGAAANPDPVPEGEFQCGGGSGGSGAPLCGLVFKGG